MAVLIRLCPTYAPISVFPQSGEGRITPGNWTILKNWGLIPYSCDTILCLKSPRHAFRFRHNFFEIFSLKHLRSLPSAKVICQIPEGSDCFGSLIPRVSPSTPLWGKTLTGALGRIQYMHFLREIKIIMLFFYIIIVWRSESVYLKCFFPK